MTPEQQKAAQAQHEAEARKFNLRMDLYDFAQRLEIANYLADMALTVLRGQKVHAGHISMLNQVLSGEDSRQIKPFSLESLRESFRRMLNDHQAKAYVAREGGFPSEDGRSYGFGVAFLVVAELKRAAGGDYADSDFEQVEKAQKAIAQQMTRHLGRFRMPRGVGLLKKKARR